jgi:hypothetical protein
MWIYSARSVYPSSTGDSLQQYGEVGIPHAAKKNTALSILPQGLFTFHSPPSWLQQLRIINFSFMCTMQLSSSDLVRIHSNMV